MTSRWVKFIGIGIGYHLIILLNASAFEVSLKGVPFWERSTLESFIRLSFQDDETVDSMDLEDSLFLLGKRLMEDGYLKATVDLYLESDTAVESIEGITLDRVPYLEGIPEGLNRAEYRVHRGIRYFYKRISIDGLSVLKEADALDYFYRDLFLLSRESERTYSQNRLEKGISQLREQIRLMGYADAEVRVRVVDVDDTSGAVEVELEVVEGPFYRIQSIEPKGVLDDLSSDLRDQLERVNASYLGELFSELSLSQLRMELRRLLYRSGYAFAKLSIERREVLEIEPGERGVALGITYDMGPRVRLGEIYFNGNTFSDPDILRRLSGLENDANLNPSRLEEARNRLRQTEAIEQVQYQYGEPSLEKDGEETRDVTFMIKERKRYEANLILGYGSYEGVRGGMEFSRYNLLGKAHNLRLRVIQSQKSTDANVRYQVPHIFGERWDVEGRISYLKRDELSFVREEYGADIGIQIPRLIGDGDLFVRYSLESLNAEDVAGRNRVVGNESLRASSIKLQYGRDFRDNPVYPSTGFYYRTELELAHSYLGSEASYVRGRLDYGIYFSMTKYWTLGIGGRHGMVGDWESSNFGVPYNKRFFTGGHHSIRGFQEGAGSPLDASGNILGAEVFHLIQVELERPLYPDVFAVFFVDGLLQSESVDDFPGEEVLGSYGAGIRWRTPLGPLRLEYAKVMNPREFDQTDRWHLSIGFPF